MENVETFLIEKYGYILDKREASKALKVSPATVDRLRKSGELKSRTIGGKIVFGVKEIGEILTYGAEVRK